MAPVSERDLVRRRPVGRFTALLAVVLLTAGAVLTGPSASADTGLSAGGAETEVVAGQAGQRAEDKGLFAIGDSFASGQGSPDYGNKFEANQACGRSYRSWPYLLGADTSGLTWVDSA